MTESYSLRDSELNQPETSALNTGIVMEAQTQQQTSAASRLEDSSANRRADTTASYVVFSSPYGDNQSSGGGGAPNREGENPRAEAPAAQSQRRPAEAAAVLTAAQITNLVRGEHGLGSETYSERAAAQRQLEHAGVSALPAVMAALHDRANPVPLEVQRRCESLGNTLMGRGFGDLIAGTRSADFAVSTAAQAFLSRQSTESLLLGSTYNQLSADNQATLNQLVTTRLTEQQLRQMSGANLPFGPIGKLWTQLTDERGLRLAVAADQVLGQSGTQTQYSLGALLAKSGNPQEQAYGESLLKKYTEASDDPASNGSAHRILANAAFRRGDTAQGMTLTRDGMHLLETVAARDPSQDLILNEFRQFANLPQGVHLTPAQQQELQEISQRASQAANEYAGRLSEWNALIGKKLR